jgi:acetyltransferase-like isoleucine patch superfamily enzyme
MLSDEILLQAGDQHSIWNLDDNSVAIVEQPPIVIREHAWIGRRVTLMAGASIGCGSIVGTASVVTGEVADFALAVGVPARVIKQHVTWSRNVEWFSPLERDFLARRRPLADHPAIEPAK